MNEKRHKRTYEMTFSNEDYAITPSNQFPQTDRYENWQRPPQEFEASPQTFR